MGHVGRCPDYRSLSYFPYFLPYQHARLSREDEIKFVGTGVRVGPLRLPGLKTVEADKEMLSSEEVGFGWRFSRKADGSWY
jgi:hypothetical protein